MNAIDKKLEQFQKDAISLRELPPVKQQHYMAIARKIIEAEQMPQAVLIQLAHRIKPLMYPKEGTKLSPGLYWTKPEPLKESFYFNFNADSVAKDQNGNILPVEGLEKVSEFTCYHRYGGYYGCLRPGMDEIIQQFPAYLLEDDKAEYAIELKFPSSQLHDVFDSVLNRHVSTVIVYRLKSSLPEEIRNQAVIYER